MRFCKEKVTVIQEHDKLSTSIQDFLKEKVYHSTGLLKTYEHAHVNKQMSTQKYAYKYF